MGLRDDAGSRGDGGLSRREFLHRAGRAGLAVPGMAALLAACSSTNPGPGNGNGGNATPGARGTPKASANPFGTGGVGGAPYPLARRDAPVTWNLFDDNPAAKPGLSPESGPLRVFGYNDYIYKAVLQAFEKRYRTKVQYTVFDTPDEMVAKLQSGAASFDLVCTVTLDNVGKLVASKLLQPLNHSYLPNFDANVWPSLKSPFYDQESRYTAPYTLYSTGVGWRNDLVKQEVGGMDNPYDVLWDPAYRGKTHLLNGSRDPIAMALLRNGVTDVNTTDQATLDKAKDDLLEGVSKMNWKFDHTDYNELGQWSLHHTWSGQVAYYQYYLPKGLEITRFSYVWPPAGPGKAPGLLQNDVLAIPKAAKNPVLAHAMIDFLLDTKHATDNYGYEGFQPPINALEPDRIVSMGLVPPNLKNIVITDADVALGLSTLELTPAANQLWQSIYQQVSGGA